VVSGPLWFRITTRAGEVVVGPVQGHGGLVGGATTHLPPARRRKIGGDRMLLAVRQAGEEGRVREFHEPEPGCCLCFPSYGAGGNGRPVVVDLAGATARVQGGVAVPQEDRPDLSSSDWDALNDWWFDHGGWELGTAELSRVEAEDGDEVLGVLRPWVAAPRLSRPRPFVLVRFVAEVSDVDFFLPGSRAAEEVFRRHGVGEGERERLAREFRLGQSWEVDE